MTSREASIADFIEAFRVEPDSKVTLARDFDPAFKGTIRSKKQGRKLLAQGVELLAEYQSRLYAEHTHGVLVVLQALDAAGKDGTIRHVMTGVNPQGVSVHSFKVPSSEELDHDYLWRYGVRLPGRGEIAIFNRSHYEEVLVVRVHPETSAGQPGPGAVETALSRDQRVGANPQRQRHQDREALLEPLQGGAAHPLPTADRPSRSQLEVLLGRPPRA
jgi:polyphosphate kinase 2 (PPK2 family)